MTRGQVVTQSHDANGIVMDKAHANPILDARMYQVELAEGEVAESRANVITESMCTQCDADQTSTWGRPVNYSAL